MADTIFWEFTGETKIEFGVELKQIRAVCDFGFVSKGEAGGWISDAVELAQNGLAWIGKSAKALGGTIRGGIIEGGIIWGGDIRGGTIRGGIIEGGIIWGGIIEGGTIRGGTILGGTIRGGIIEGGIIEGGDIRGGTIRGGDFLTISPVGSEDGQFTAEITDEGKIICNRGCWFGTLEEFEAAVAETHDENEHSKAYALIINLVRMRLGPIAAERAKKYQRPNQ